MTTTYNTQRLAKAVFAGNTQVVKGIIESGDFNHDILTDVIKALDIKVHYDFYTDKTLIPPIPLYYISLCQHIRWNTRWSEKYQPTADKNLERCKELLDYWQSIGYDTSIHIDFSFYQKLCALYAMGLESTFEEDGTFYYKENEYVLDDDDELFSAIVSYNKDRIFAIVEERIKTNHFPHEDHKNFDDYDILWNADYDAYEYGLNDYDDGSIDETSGISFSVLAALFHVAAYREIQNYIERYEKSLISDIS